MKPIKRSIPGITGTSSRVFMYIESCRNESFRQIIDAALGASSDLPLPKFGGVIEEKVQVRIDDYTTLIGISYKGDIEGWQDRLVGFCKEAGRVYGFIKDEQFCLSTGATLPLEDITFYME